MKYDFTTLQSRAGVGSIKWNMMHAIRSDLPEDVVPISVADMEFLNPPQIAQEVGKYLQEMILGYTEPVAGYYEAVLSWMERRHNWKAEKEWMVSWAGIVPALYQAVQAYTDAGDGVIIFPPAYPPFFAAIRQGERQVVECPLLYENNRYDIDFALFEKLAAGERNKLLILASPHNPVGRVWRREELEKIAAICAKNGVVVVSDEIHSDLIVGDVKHTVFASVSEEAKNNCVVCTAPSKTFNLAGMQTSNLFIPNAALREKMVERKARLGIGGCNIAGYKACEVAYSRCEDWLDQLLEVLRENKALMESFLAEHIPEIKLIPLEGTYLQWMDCRGLGMSTEKLEQFMQSALWFTDEGYIFETGGAGFERINIACPTWVLKSLLERLAKAWEEKKQSK